ncbi:MAG: tryptophan 7-halogenase [Oscillospiraceae bacterium]|jgi:2-polyprenyl-6-methoxyphenol hydroxylase-like FAD-dependent oxidoreductase|nr:tryptophan 7-halogenase [Oscillospiraceae bacterium]
MHILILGGGAAGLALAGLIDNSKHRVVVLEQDSPEEFAKKWNWYDNLNVAELRRLGYAEVLPDSFPEQGERTVASPSGKFKLRFKIERPLSYEPVARQRLLSGLREKAREKAGLRYDAKAESLLVEDGRVAGVLLPDGREIRADLTIDCTGATELSRPLLGDLFRTETETVTVFRGIFPHEQIDAAPAIDNVVLKPLGIPGVSRYSINASDKTDVYIGCVGSANGDRAAKILEELLKEHSPWDKPDINAGTWGKYKIPARCPLPQFVFDGYALLGDSACMSALHVGSGIVNALHGAKILADLVNKDGGTDISTLWSYQVRYYRETAKSDWRVDVFNRWLLEIPDEVLESMFSSRILTPDDAERVFTGRFISFAPKNILHKGAQLILHPRLLFSIIGVFVRSIWVEECRRSIPEQYDAKRVAVWQQRLARAME